MRRAILHIALRYTAVRTVPHQTLQDYPHDTLTIPSRLSCQMAQPTPMRPESSYILDLPARSAHITPLARRRSASRAYARENTLPSSAKWGPFRCSFSERTRMRSQSDRTYRPYYPPIYIPLLMYYVPTCLPILYHYIFRNTS